MAGSILDSCEKDMHFFQQKSRGTGNKQLELKKCQKLVSMAHGTLMQNSLVSENHLLPMDRKDFALG